MEIHNTRSPEQWSIISRHIEFKDKTVLDTGCGRGDIIIRAFDAGGKVTGVDLATQNIDYIRDKRPGIDVACGDIELLGPFHKYNILICFSVLPYLSRPGHFLQWINRYSDVALIECQYQGDGPGFDFLKGNDDMKSWLLEVGQFQKAEVIGHTFVEDRDKMRHIWMCE